jgi:hypothetical protein
MPRRSAGVSGVGVTLVALGGYLAYAGIRDVPVLDGLRQVLKGDLPTPRERAEPGKWSEVGEDAPSGDTDTSGGGGTQGDLGLVGNALAALPAIRAAAPGATLGGRAGRPNNPSSDHPLGKAIDVMTRDDAVAQRVIRTFKGTRGAKYWIWNGRLGHVNRLWVSYPYTEFGGHYDHVHLSWF